MGARREETQTGLTVSFLAKSDPRAHARNPATDHISTPAQLDKHNGLPPHHTATPKQAYTARTAHISIRVQTD